MRIGSENFHHFYLSSIIIKYMKIKRQNNKDYYIIIFTTSLCTDYKSEKEKKALLNTNYTFPFQCSIPGLLIPERDFICPYTGRLMVIKKV